MTLGEARDHIGEEVIYSTRPGEMEAGVVTSVSDSHVFVRYGRGPGSQATRPDCLTLMLGGSLAEHVRLGMAGIPGFEGEGDGSR